MKLFISEWEKLTSDDSILDIVKHCHLEFENDCVPSQTSLPHQIKFNNKECLYVKNEIDKLLKMEVIMEIDLENVEFVSTIFLRPKRNGEFRMILNLKELNQFIKYHHFKMDTFESALKIITPNCFMSSVDLKNAYYSIPVATEHQQFLQFFWEKRLFQFTSLPQGLSSAPRLFTKLLKPVYATLRRLGYLNVGYIDDSLLVGETIQECSSGSSAMITLVEKLGFFVNYEKSVLKPAQKIAFLGNIIDSVKMTVTLTDERKENILYECKKLHKKSEASIRKVASVIGLIVSSFSAIEFGPLHYRSDIEQSYHINALELVACFNALKSFFKDQRDTSIKVMTDNVTAVSYINNMGGIHSQLCNDIASQIWIGALIGAFGYWLSTYLE